MAVSAIVSNFNGLKFLPRLLESLRSQINVDLEIVVVDRHSTDGSVEFLAKQEHIVVISEPPETGLVSGYHAGSRVATKENYFFCNEDMWFEPPCLSLLEKNLSPEKGIIATDPWQWNYEGTTLIHAGTRFHRCLFSMNSAHPFYEVDFEVPVENGDLVPLPCAGAFMINARAYREIGAWDGQFFLNHEDVDLFIRAWQRDLKCVSVPSAKSYHAGGASNQKVIEGGKVLVGKRRYISSFASVAIIGLKYYTGLSMFAGLWNSVIRLVLNLIRLRREQVKWDFLVLKEIFSRLPYAMSYRSKYSDYNCVKPGQKFFADPRFLNPVKNSFLEN